MSNLTVKLSRVLSISFSSEVLTQHSYLPKESGCKSCSGGCGDNVAEPKGCGDCDTNANGCGGGDKVSKGPQHALTVHQVTDGILHCESPQDTRILQARYVVTDDDGKADYPALRAFKDDDELLGWVANIGQDLKDVKTILESQLTPLLHN